MRVAVTGASGFVARHLIPLLLEQGHEVRGLARHSPEHTGSQGTASGFTFIPGDVRLRADVGGLLEGCDRVVHMAASFSPEDKGADISERGTRTIVDAARAAGVKKLVFLSCLGAEAASPSVFFRSKWRAGQMVRAAEIPYSILLPALIVGNGDGVTRPLADLIRSLPVLPALANGSPRQQPIDVGDLCQCILAALDEDQHVNEMVSIGGPTFLTMRELVALIAAELGRDVPPVQLPAGLAGVAPRLLMGPARELFSGPRRALFEHGVVTSPGIVQRMFGFEPVNIASRIGAYLA
jgi:NADH dehydrogenase